MFGEILDKASAGSDQHKRIRIRVGDHFVTWQVDRSDFCCGLMQYGRFAVTNLEGRPTGSYSVDTLYAGVLQVLKHGYTPYWESAEDCWEIEDDDILIFRRSAIVLSDAIGGEYNEYANGEFCIYGMMEYNNAHNIVDATESMHIDNPRSGNDIVVYTVKASWDYFDEGDTDGAICDNNLGWE